MTILHADSIAKRLGDRKILSAATMTADRGTITGLLGRMGEGKSTLMKICAGLIPPDSGWVRFDGIQYIRPRLHRLSKGGLYYLADSGNLASSLTLRQHMEAVHRRFATAASDESIVLMHLEGLLDSPPGQMSSGERRRAEIGLAIARRPKCLIVDEPFRSLDPLICDMVGSGLRMAARNGCAVIISGHEVRALTPWLDSIVWLTSGTTHHLGSPADAMKNEAFSRDYLGSNLERSPIAVSEVVPPFQFSSAHGSSLPGALLKPGHKIG